MPTGEGILQAVGAALILALVFRWVSAARWPLPDASRVAVGSLVVYATVLAMLWLTCSSWTLLMATIAVAIASLAIRGEGLAKLTDAMGRMRLSLYLSSVFAVAVVVLVLVPLTTFLTSRDELDIEPSYLLSASARATGLVVYVAAILYMLAFTSRMRTLLALIAMTALALAIVYAFALPLGYPPMSGLTFERIPLPVTSIAVRALVDSTVVTVAVLGVCATLIRFGARPLLIAVALVNISMVGAFAPQFAKAQAGNAPQAEGSVQAQAQPLRFSPTQPNVLIVYLDRFMGSYIESLMQSEPGLSDRLRGFTWFPRTLAAGHNSVAGVHPMLGGYDYMPLAMNARGDLLRDQSLEAFSILPYNFASKGYRVNLLSPRGMGFTMEGDCSLMRVEGVNCTHFPKSVAATRAKQMGFPLSPLPKSGYTDLLSLLAAMRGTPYLLKEAIHEKGPWEPFMGQSMNTTFREWAQLQALEELSRTDGVEPNWNYVHSLLPHDPYYLGENCLPLREPFKVSDDEVRRRGHRSLFSLQHAIAARCSLLRVADYFDFLQRAGVYDNTKIVIVSDHGIVGPVEDRSSRAVAGGTTDAQYVASRSVLLVKERNATGALKISEEFMPNAEMPRIVCEEIGGCVNPYLDNRPIVADGRDDPFYVSDVPAAFSAQQPTKFTIREQRVLKGKDPFDARGWAMLE